MRVSKGTRTALGRFFAFWKKANPAKQRELLRTLFEKIEVFPENQIRVLLCWEWDALSQ